jgi:tRNA A-37 threonylcarbamoyl transferase component Bud32
MARAGSIDAAIELPERYEVVRLVARGGMAAVWEAKDGLLGRPVAVKVLAEHLAQDASARERFQREARAAAKVSDHPNVVTIYDVGEYDDRPFIVMELLTGGSVARRLKEGRPSHAEALTWLAQAAAALDDTHERGLVHRDIKPHNLLLDGRGRLAVADFGIARLAHDQTLTATGQVLGTAAYLSPEQAIGEAATPASDRYSLAVVAFELLTGERPFKAEHFAGQARQHIEAPPPPASEIRPELPPEVDAVLGRGLAKEPGRRWPTAGAMVRGLVTALGGERESTKTTRVLQRATRALPPIAPAAAAPAEAAPPAEGRDGVEVPPVEAFPGRQRARRARPPVIALALLAAVALVGAILVATSGGGSSKLTAHVDHATNKRAQDAADRRAADRSAQRAQTPTQSTPAPSPGGGGNPNALNDQGFQLMNAGQLDQAIPVLQRAVNACGGDPSRLVCAYAIFNLGKALRLAGRPQEAIPWLQKRLENPNQRGKVEAELQAARAAAGQGGAPAPGPPGKGKDKPKDHGGGGKDGGGD